MNKADESDNKQVDILISQYEQCWADLRDHRVRYWQIPLSIYLTDFAILAIAFQFSETIDLTIKVILSSVVIVSSVMFLFQLYKERYFEMSRVGEIKRIEKKLIEKGG